ncbi:MAG: universal stress protein [Lentisphaerae bacterium]|mgnify:FL=1|nr:universal stress protein [Lentisphaerota bacterium]
MPKDLNIRHILVLVDGTDSAARAVELAANLARALRARLTGLHVIELETLHQLLSANVLTPAEMEDFEGGLKESGNRHLDAARKVAHGHGVTLEAVSVTGNSELVVPREVESRGVDLLVIGAFDSSQVRFELLFRQRQQVLDHAPCPVLVAR